MEPENQSLKASFPTVRVFSPCCARRASNFSSRPKAEHIILLVTLYVLFLSNWLSLESTQKATERFQNGPKQPTETQVQRLLVLNYRQTSALILKILWLSLRW